jgi:signal transduction histidine kinase
MPAVALPRGRFARLAIRHKLLAMALLPLAGTLPLLAVILLWWSGEAFDRMLITKIRSDLAVAQGYFERTLAEVGASAGTIAESHSLQLAIAAGPREVAARLADWRERERLDFANLRGPDGTLRATQGGPAAASDAPSPPFPPAAAHRELTSVELVTAEQLARIAPGLEARVPITLVPTRNAAPTERRVEDRALLLQAIRPVRDRAGRLLGHVQAGVLLNRNLAFIDHVNEIVYPEGALPFGSRGTATLFLDDVRVSTNVRLFGADANEGGERAIGTRVSQTVRETVLGEGRTWLDRAFVVNDWYVSAYLPIVDGAGTRVGMLYVGFLERPFTNLKLATLGAIGALFVATMALAAIVSLRWARAIFRPIEQMESTMRRVEAGALEARVGAVASDDELGRLAGHLDRLLDAVGEKTRALQRWNAELDAKVAERTRALEETQAHLVRSEKLATVGQLTASIAHEVNNPIAVIQGNLDLLRELLDAETAARLQPELKLIDQQIERMRLVVTQLLQFARPTEYAGYVESLDAGQLLEESLLLVRHLLAKATIELRRDYGARRRVEINRQELQQVLVNLLVNAIDAMPGGGRLELATRDVGSQVVIEITDSGAGLPPEVLARLFQPFATRKQHGTGLGLWISRGIVERYGGDLRGANRDDGTSGARFTVVLNAEALTEA